jgi:DNA repair protein RadD
MIELRPYQADAVSKLLWSRNMEGADLAVLPTGSGKSIIIAELAKQLGEPILILQPTKEILEQNYAKLCHYVDPKYIGIYSASMNRKDIHYWTFATIQSIYKKPEDFNLFHFVILDECHLLNPKNLDGMFTSFLHNIGDPKVAGLTATPYRLTQMYQRVNGGLLTHTTTKLINRLREHFWHRIVFNTNIQELIDQGYLVPLNYIDKSVITQEEIPTNITRSDFDMSAFESKIATKQAEVTAAIAYGQKISQHLLVFCSSVLQAELLTSQTPNSAVVTANTNKKDRTKIINDFRSGVIHTVFNVGVLTTGFDFPELDGIVLLRPTMSIGLYYQMLGRGVRPAPGKTCCNIIDLTGTVKKLGHIETIRLERIDNKWELLSEKGSWHYKSLYTYAIQSQ